MPIETNTVVFLGAGASKDLDLPLTNEIMPHIRARLDGHTLFAGNISDGQKDRQELQELFDSLLPGKKEEAPFITDLLSMMDHAVAQANAIALDHKSDRIAYKSPKDLLRLRTLLERAIYEVLKREYPISAHTTDADEEVSGEAAQALYCEAHRKPVNEAVLHEFVTWMQREANACSKLSIVTTNYDLVPEQLQQQLMLGNSPISVNDVDFGFPWRDPKDGKLHYRPENARLSIYKLHGSLNWLRCALCEHTYINPHGDVAYLGFDSRFSTHNLCHCTYWPLRHVMVAPSMVRDVRDPNILQVWMAALEALRLAERWYIIGYSLPPEDLAIRSLLMRAYRARGYADDDAVRPEPQISVVQLDDTGMKPYQLLFGKVSPECGGLKAFLQRQNQSATAA
jgi:hypothetical protein